jgi:uncharacterized membrane protein
MCRSYVAVLDGRRVMMGRRLGLLWVLIILPFVLAGLTGGPGGNLPGPGATLGRLLTHAGFHLVYILFLIGAILLLLGLRSVTESGIVRGVALALVIAQAVTIAGQVGEDITVFQHGGFSSGREMFNEPQHLFFATYLTFPGLFGGLILLVVLTIAAVVATRAQRRRASSAGAA